MNSHPEVVDLALSPDEDAAGQLNARLAKVTSEKVAASGEWRVKTRTIDARHKKVRIRYQIAINPILDDSPSAIAAQLNFPTASNEAPPVIVIGAGPAGMFCAWRLLKRGHRVVVLERGGDVRGRRPALASLNREGTLDEEQLLFWRRWGGYVQR